MNQSDYDNFVDVMQLVSEQYGKKPSDGLISLYWQGLKNYDFPAVREAIGRHLGNTDNGQFMPKIADIIRMMEGSSMDSAYSAWTKVDKAVRQVGPYESVVFDDPLIHKVLSDMGGWIMLSEKTNEEWPFVAKEFENRYKGFKSRNEKVEYSSKLIGISEAGNRKKGQAIGTPMLIGNKTKALEVFNNGEKGVISIGLTKFNDILKIGDKNA